MRRTPRVLPPAWILLAVFGLSFSAWPLAGDHLSDAEIIALRTWHGNTLVIELSLAPGSLAPSGIGLAMAFDARELELSGLPEVFAPGLLAPVLAAEPDGGDVDGNPRTDSVLRLAWWSPGGPWEGHGGGVLLGRLVFHAQTAPGAEPVLAIVPLGHSPTVRVSWSPGRVGPPSRRLSGARSRGFEVVDAVEPKVAAVKTLASTTIRLRPSVPTQLAASTAACSLDADGNGQLDALTDGVLIARHLFGFSGATLVKDAVGAGATRTSGEAVTAFLDAGTCGPMLDADGSGTRDALTDGILIARYLFGFSGATLVSGAVAPTATRTDGPAIASWLALFRSTEPALDLRAPTLPAPLVSEIPAQLQLVARYTGSMSVQYSLLQGPAGMTIRPDSGTLLWTPPRSLEGQQATVRAGASDGSLVAEVTFTVQVAAPVQVSSTVSGSTVTVTQSGTLQGLAVTLPAQASISPSEVKVSTLTTAQAPPAPTGVTRLSDFFRVTPVSATGDADIAVLLPGNLVPAGRRREELRIYAFVEGALGVSGAFWMPVRRGLDVLSGGKVKLLAPRLGHVSFVGLPSTSLGTPVASSLSTPLPAAVSCQKQTFSDGTVAYWQHVCTVPEPEGFTVTVRDVDSSPTLPKPADVAKWMHEARLVFRPWGMLAAATIEVFVETMPTDDPRLANAGGYCDDSGDLHISSKLAAADDQRSAIVHEFFHHAQRKTKATASGHWPLFNTYPRSSWFLEGTAVWFEDEALDGKDSYRNRVGQPFPHILDVGLNAPEPPNPSEYASPAFPYSRFAFFKWLRRACGTFNFMYLLNPKREYEETGLENLAAWVASKQCAFGNGFGSTNAGSFASGLLGYAARTAWLQDLSAIEEDESGEGFGFAGVGEIQTSAECTPDQACPPTSYAYFSLPAAGARALAIKPTPLIIGQKPFLKVESDEEVWVSLWSAEELPEINPADLDLDEFGIGMHATWFRSNQIELYEHSNGQTFSAAMFLTVVNPSLTRDATVVIRSGVQEGEGAKPFDLTFTANANPITNQVFSLHSTGSISGPSNLTYQRTESHLTGIDINITAARNQEGVVIEGRIEGGIEPLVARKTYGSGDYTEYTYSNKRYIIDLETSPTKNTFRFEFPSFITEGAGKACIIYDCIDRSCDKDNNCTSSPSSALRCVHFWVKLQ